MGRDGSGVKKASASSIEISFVYRGVRCRERIALEPTPANLKRVTLHRAAILDAIARDTFDYSITFPNSPRAKLFAPLVRQDLLAGYLDDWLARKEKHIKSSTYRNYEKIVNNRLIPQFGKTALAALTRKDIRDWLDTIDASNKTLSNIQSCFRSALADAIDDEILQVNPLAGWTYQRRDVVPTASDIDPFTAEEQAAILAQLSGQGANLVQFAFWTGLRTSELVALEWGDVDWLRGEVRVMRAMTQAAKTPETPKTAAGARCVKLLRPALAALQRQKEHTLLAGAQVFQNPRTLEPWTGDQAIRKTLWTPALRRAGVRYRRPYQTRHTYASMMLSAGEHPMWVAQQMGHRDWGMIRQIYGRWMPPEDAQSGSKAERLFAGKDNEKTASPRRPRK